MDGTEYLLTRAEIAAALAGFSALVVAISGRPGSRLRPMSRTLVSTLIERSLLAVFFSLVPVLLTGLGLSPSLVWLTCSGSLAAYIGSMAWRSAAARRTTPEQTEMVPQPVFAILMVCGLVATVLQVAHAAGLGLQQSAWWHLVGLTWILLTVAYLFFFGVRQWARSD